MRRRAQYGEKFTKRDKMKRDKQIKDNKFVEPDKKHK